MGIYQKQSSKKNNPVAVIFSIVFFFIFAPKIARLAYRAGYDYTNGKNGAGFPHLTQKDELGHFVPKFGAPYAVGVIATAILGGLVSLAVFLGITRPVAVGSLRFMGWVNVFISAFVVIFMCFMVVFLWAYIRGMTRGVNDKIATVNKKLHDGEKFDKFGEIKEPDAKPDPNDKDM